MTLARRLGLLVAAGATASWLVARDDPIWVLVLDVVVLATLAFLLVLWWRRVSPDAEPLAAASPVVEAHRETSVADWVARFEERLQAYELRHEQRRVAVERAWQRLHELEATIAADLAPAAP